MLKKKIKLFSLISLCAIIAAYLSILFVTNLYEIHREEQILNAYLIENSYEEMVATKKYPVKEKSTRNIMEVTFKDEPNRRYELFVIEDDQIYTIAYDEENCSTESAKYLNIK